MWQPGTGILRTMSTVPNCDVHSADLAPRYLLRSSSSLAPNPPSCINHNNNIDHACYDFPEYQASVDALGWPALHQRYLLLTRVAVFPRHPTPLSER